MKKYSVIIYVVCSFCSYYANAQSTIKDIFNPDIPITYLGIDFSNAKCYGEGSLLDARKFAKDINDLVRNEYTKYNVTTALKKNKLYAKFDLTEKLNANIDENKFFTYSPADLEITNEDSINSIVANYNLTGYEPGLAIVFIVDNLNKQDKEEVIWVTFLDIVTKKVLFTEPLSAIPAGFGIRNYWASPFYDIIKNIRLVYYDQWKKEYCKL